MAQPESPSVETRSGIRSFEPARLEELPESPGVYRIYSYGQKAIYVGHAGDEGLREALWELYESGALGGAAYFDFAVCDDEETADSRAADEIESLKPIYNIGFGRLRNDELTVPKQGHGVRREGLDPP